LLPDDLDANPNTTDPDQSDAPTETDAQFGTLDAGLDAQGRLVSPDKASVQMGNVALQVFDLNGSLLLEQQTNEDGRIFIEKLPTGVVRIESEQFQP